MSLLHATRRRRDALRLALLALSFTIGMAFACAAADSTQPRLDAVVVPPPPARTPAGLWLASTDAPAMLRLTPSQLAAGGHVTPSAVVRATTVRIHSLVGVAFDPSGRMWVASQGDSVLLAYSPLQLDARGPRAVESVIRAKGQRYVMANVRRDLLDKVRAILPGLGGPTVIDILNGGDHVAVHAVVPVERIYQTIGDLRAIGATGVLVTRIERLVP